MIGRPRRKHTVTHDGRLVAKQSAVKAGPIHHAKRSTQTFKELTRGKGFRVFLLSLFGIIGIICIWLLVSSFVAYSRVVDRNTTGKAPILSFLGEIGADKLNGEGDGRVNVLLIGVGGTKHPGGNLADTIMVASFDPKNKEAALLSIPRDLYVPIDTRNSAKINALHSYGEQDTKKYGSGPAILKKTVSSILDLPIHYYVRVDFEALTKLVDTLGGVTVDVEKPIVDLSYPADDMVNYSPFRLSAGLQTLDGKTALRYARSRHASGSEGSDFARARRQQKLITAIKEKSLNVGFLSNPKKIVDILGILGSHVKTDLTATEMERFISLWKDVDGSKIVTKVLDNGPGGPLVSESGDSRGYILLPRAGDFSEVQQIAHEIFTDPYLREEKAAISLVNASGSTTIGKQVATMLKSYGYQVTDNTQTGQAKATKTTLVDHTNDKPYTKKFLEGRFKVTATSDKVKSDQQEYNLSLTIGTDYKPTQVQNVKTTPKTSASPRASATPKSASPAASN